jgi:hypothetical protein
VGTEITVDEPALLIRIARSYKPVMSDRQLYEITRGVWRLGPARDTAEIALALNAAEWLRRGLLLSLQLLFFRAMSAPSGAAYPLCRVFRCAWPALGTAYLLPRTADEWLPQNRPARCVVEVVEQLGMSEPVRQRREP